MNYPTPMDVAESEDRAAMTATFDDELAKCSVLYTENLVAEREALIAELAECTEKRERYALQVCLLLDAMREAGVHINEKWCWCGPAVESHKDSAPHTSPQGDEAARMQRAAAAWDEYVKRTTSTVPASEVAK